MASNNINYNQSGDFLNSKQKEAAEHLTGPVLIAAGAGSGKTRTLTSRLIKLIESGVSPESIVAVTFTNKAAKEMANRVANLQPPTSNLQPPFIGTLHSFGVGILKREAGFFSRGQNFSIFDSDDSLRLIKRIIKIMDVDADQLPAAAAQNKISWLKNELITPRQFKLQTETVFEKRTALVFQRYEESLARNNAFDFDDLIEKPVRLFKKNSAVLQKYQNKWSYFLVDEYQDVNASQYWLLKLLARKHQNICAVGDDQQAIYRFRGADFRNFLNFEKDWPKAKVVLLEENYRSSANIIKAASAVISQNQFQKPKTLWTQNQSGDPLMIIKTNSEEDEAEWIADATSRTEKAAILYRTNAQSRLIEQALLEKEIPYVIFGGIKFYERKEIKDIVAGLRYGLNPKDEISLERLNKNFNKSAATTLIQNLPLMAQKENISELVGFFIETIDYFRYLENNFKNFEERQENVRELIKAASGFQNFKPPFGLQLFLEQSALTQAGDKPKDIASPSVKLMTVHLAKGLEFDTVFIAGCNEGILPHHRSYGSQEDLEEERRLFYVAMTRARKNLFLSFSKNPSRFLSEIPPELVKFENLAGESADFDSEENYIDINE
ncbi:MAG: UvrD-helicase domain-containing protein [Patescibacteria group bacterium]